MPQDFAKKRASQNKNAPRKNGRAATKAGQHSESAWSWFFSGLFSGLFIAFIAYLALGQPEPGTPLSADSNAATPEEQGEDGRNNFDFYQYLPEAVVEVDVVPVAMRAAPEDDNQQYLLQAGSFQNRQDAESRRANVILLNLDASVVPGIVAGKTWHRVQVGPFTGRKAAEDARAMLSSNNIDTIVLRLRQEEDAG